MKRTQVVREVADELHKAEAVIESAVAESEAALQRLISARKELGLTGTLGDAAIARVRESLASMREARTSFYEGHEEVYRIYQMLDMKDVTIASTVLPSSTSFKEEVRVA